MTIRQLTERNGLSLQYKYSRNDGHVNEDYYRYNVYALGLNVSILGMRSFGLIQSIWNASVDLHCRAVCGCEPFLEEFVGTPGVDIVSAGKQVHGRKAMFWPGVDRQVAFLDGDDA